MTTTLPATAAAYIRATNDHDAAAFMNCFAKSAVVNDAGREFHGLAAIKAWSQHEIMDAMVTLEVLDVADRPGEVTITTKVDKPLYRALQVPAWGSAGVRGQPQPGRAGELLDCHGVAV